MNNLRIIANFQSLLYNLKHYCLNSYLLLLLSVRLIFSNNELLLFKKDIRFFVNEAYELLFKEQE